jgi:hypothetical protein
MSTLRSQLQDLAASFAEQVLSVIRSGSIQDLHLDGGSASSGRSSRADSPRAFASSGAAHRAMTERSTAALKANARLPRRSADEIAALLNKVVLLVKTHKGGMRAEDIRSRLGMQAKEMPRILKEGVSKKKLSAKGQKRATTYYAK